MNEKETIKGMAKLCCWFQNGKCIANPGIDDVCDMSCEYGQACEKLTSEGYRKIPEGSVVLSKEEKQKLLKEMYEQGKFDALADLEKDGKVVLSKEKYEKYKKQDLFMKDYTIVEVLENECSKARKETAEKWHYHITTTLLALWKGGKITTEIYNSWISFFNGLAKQFSVEVEE